MRECEGVERVGIAECGCPIIKTTNELGAGTIGPTHKAGCVRYADCPTCAALHTEVARMKRSLEAAHFTDEGGEYWKPPVNNLFRELWLRKERLRELCANVEEIAKALNGGYLHDNCKTCDEVRVKARKVSVMLLEGK
jgi:hypothetical protein